MATTTTTTNAFTTWVDDASSSLANNLDNSILSSITPIRTRGAQLLRDFALGKPEFGPKPGDLPYAGGTTTFTADSNMTIKPGHTWYIGDTGTSVTTDSNMTLCTGDTVTLTNFTVTAPSV